MNGLVQFAAIVTGFIVIGIANLQKLFVILKFFEDFKIFMAAVVFPESAADSHSNLFIVFDVKMIFFFDRSAKGMFHCVAKG